MPMPSPRRALPTSVVFLSLAAGGLARADAPAPSGPANEECLGCHGSSLERDKGKPIAPVGEAFAASIHGQSELSCVDCHADLQGKELPHAQHLAKPDCATCHEDAVKAYDESVHAVARKKSSDSEAATCADCHGVHDIRGAKDPQSRTYHFNVAATCAKCHANEALIARAGIKAGNVPAHFEDSIHGRALKKSGLVVAPNCATCHGNHEIRRASDDKSLINRANVPKTCGQCHAGVRADYETSVHAAALREGNPRAAVCVDCHTAHDTKAVDSAWRADLVRECGTCHQESMRTFRDTFHGKVTTLGFTRAATCADCHGSHGILPRSDPRSAIADGRRTQTCRKCHSGATDKFALYDPHADAHNRERSPVLFYIAQAMKLLLLGVFIFFGLHTLLWLGRSLVAVRRLQAEGKIDDRK
jgi:nitrate/TMAO reductase-like tetraheme cytochrome c subunit